MNAQAIPISIVFIVAALVGDAIFTRTFGLVFSSTLNQSIFSFILIAMTVAAGQNLVLSLVRKKTKATQFKQGMGLEKLNRIIMAGMIMIVSLLFLVSLQLVISASYSTYVLLTLMTVSYSLAIFTMVVLARSFRGWFAVNKSSLLFVYFSLALVLTTHLVFTLFFVDLSLLNMQTEMRTTVGRVPYFPPGSLISILNSIWTFTSISAFLASWVASVVLLRHYSERFGKLKYWTLVSIPLIYFMFQFPSLLLNLFDPLMRTNPIFLTTILTLLFQMSKPIGGLMFGFAFWASARKIRQSSDVRLYVAISAFGFILLFASDQAISLIGSPFPPFGVPAVSTVALSSYLILVGIYYTAVSVSKDEKLRRDIKNFVDSKLPAIMGSAQMNIQIQKAVTEVLYKNRDSISSESEIKPSLGEEDLKQYLNDVLEARSRIGKKRERD